MLGEQTIYLDYAATTPVDERVAEVMCAHLTRDGLFGNPASGHAPGRAARAAVERSRSEVAALIGAKAQEIVWTSGATEAINLAIKGAADFNTRHCGREPHIITSRIEHKATLDTCKALEAQGYRISWLEPGSDGRLAPEAVAEALTDCTVLVSAMLVNNEIGTINDIRAIADLAHARGALMHVDAAQAAGKIAVNVDALGADMLSLSAHKLYGPKGIGALYVRHDPLCRIECQVHGGGHEGGMRSGTLATHQIVGLGTACRLAGEDLPSEAARITALRQRLETKLLELGGVRINGHAEARAPGIANLAFEGVDGESLMFALSDLACSTGSACTSTDRAPSYVLRAIGCDDDLARSALRLSLGRYTDDAQIDRAVARISEEVVRLRGISAGRAADA